jgi:UDP-N-acetylmuramoylalanine--D-glutamate ligase
VAAVRSTERPLVLIAGGFDKKLSLEALAEEIALEAEGLVAIGETGPTLARQTREAARREDEGPTVELADTLEEAVERGLELSPAGGSLLFSPACASFDMFENSEERGRAFKELIRCRAQSA